jgi:23S rRNA (pseudouridine1915-N3)-methyltransferase
MRITLIVVGRMKSGPERDLFDRYAGRFAAGAKALGLSGLNLIELAESVARQPDERKAQEAKAIRAAWPTGDAMVLLDERGRCESSSVFARRIADWRDRGRRDMAFVIGGADGLAPDLAAAGDTLGFGALTMPHQLVRVLLAEQLYRATTILSGHPYHRT